MAFTMLALGSNPQHRIARALLWRQISCEYVGCVGVPAAG